MKILAFSDLHRDVAAARRIVAASADADVVVGSGDFGTRGEGARDTLDILHTITVPVILVFGNHDNVDEMETCCCGREGTHLLHGNGVKIGATVFFGLGGEIPQRNTEPWNESVSEEEARQRLQACPQDAVLVTHTPPHGCADLQEDGTHEGSQAIRSSIERTRPVLNLCGHIHTSWGVCGTIGKTPVHNLGPSLNWLEV